jgi:hypothetical protein
MSRLPPLGPPIQRTVTYDPEGWDRLVLGPYVFPAQATVVKGGIELKLDPKKKSGTHGTTPTTHGLDPQPVEVELLTTTNQDRDLCCDILDKILPQPNAKPKPYAIQHAQIAHLRIASVLVLGCSHWQFVGPMQAKIQLKMIHWLPPKAGATNTAKGAPVRQPPNVRGGGQPENFVEKNPPPTGQPDVWAPPTFG